MISKTTEMPVLRDQLTFAEIKDIGDDLLLPWLDLYEISFPPEEKVLVSSFLALLKRKAKGLNENSHMLAALDENNRLVGMMRYDTDPQLGVAYLWYLAAHPDVRGRGIGSICHDEVLRRAREAGMQVAIMEVEIPEEIADPEHRAFAQRRIEFYKRHGALLLRGIRYIHSVGPHQPEIPLHIMVCPFEPITPEQVFEIARSLFGDNVTQTCELTME